MKFGDRAVARAAGRQIAAVQRGGAVAHSGLSKAGQGCGGSGAIIADPHQVQQVFLNLFLNAIDAIREGGQIDIYAAAMTPSMHAFYKKLYPALIGKKPYVVVRFTDNGSGMPSHVAEQVFEPFFTTKTSGAGLGLSIVYRTLKENDAEIVLESKEGKGTTFTIFFRAEAY